MKLFHDNFLLKYFYLFIYIMLNNLVPDHLFIGYVCFFLLTLCPKIISDYLGGEMFAVATTPYINNYFSYEMIFKYIITGFTYLYIVVKANTILLMLNNNKENTQITDKKSLRSQILKYVFICWNFIAAFFSMYCLYIDWDNAISLLTDSSLFCNITNYNALHLPGAALYTVTKPLEFIDTYLLLLYDKPLIFLHYYHHWLTMLVTMFLAVNPFKTSVMGVLFCYVNLFIHSIMYLYYALTAFANPLNGFLRRYKNILTVMQTLQMFIGMYFIYQTVMVCGASNNIFEIVLTFGMYSSYAYLFSLLLIKNVK